MARRREVWLVSLPLLAAGWLGAHWLAYRLVGPDHEALHGYAAHVPRLAACAATLVVAGLALAVHRGLHGAARPRVPLLPIALVPPVGFAAQEHLERLIELGSLPLAVAFEPHFVVGLALQLPVALAAVALARGLSALGYAIGCSRRRSRRRPRPEPAPLPRPRPVLARRPVLAGGHGERAPPRPAV